jgi:hypothetical protein
MPPPGFPQRRMPSTVVVPSFLPALRTKVVWGRTIRACALALVLGLVPAAASAQIRVTAAWDANADGLTAGYRVFIGTAPGVPLAEIDAGGATSAVLSLPPGAVYYVTIRAYTSQGRLGPSSADAVVDLSSPPGAPTDFRAGVAGPTASLDWAPPSAGGAPLHYLLSVGTAPGAANVVNGYAVGDVRQVSGDLPQGTYFARLYAANLLGVGPPSAEIAFQITGGYRPLSPSGLSSTWVGTSAQLSWAPPTGGDGNQRPSAYIIEAGTASGASNIAVINVGAATSFLTDVPAGSYHVRVRGVNAIGVSDPSNEIVLQGRPVPGTVRNLSASGTGSAVNLRWSAPSSGGPVAGYIVEAGSAPGLSNLASLPVGAVTTFETNAPPGTYYVRVRAVNARGVGAASNEIIVRR